MHIEIEKLQVQINELNKIVQMVIQKNDLPQEIDNQLTPFCQIASELIKRFNTDEDEQIKLQHFGALYEYLRIHSETIRLSRHQSSFTHQSGVNIFHRSSTTGSWVELNYLEPLEKILSESLESFNAILDNLVVGKDENSETQPFIKIDRNNGRLFYRFINLMQNESAENSVDLAQLERRALLMAYFYREAEAKHHQIEAAKNVTIGMSLAGLGLGGVTGGLLAYGVSTVACYKWWTADVQSDLCALKTVVATDFVTHWRQERDIFLSEPSIAANISSLPLGYVPTLVTRGQSRPTQ